MKGSKHPALNRAASEFDTPGPRFDALHAGDDPLKRRRFGFAPVPVPAQEGDNIVRPLSPEEVRKLVAAGVIRFPKTEGIV